MYRMISFTLWGHDCCKSFNTYQKTEDLQSSESSDNIVITTSCNLQAEIQLLIHNNLHFLLYNIMITKPLYN